MPKIIELTVEIEVQRVSCPGVWLCQDGRVSLTVFGLGTSYQTCLLPPTFPLTFKDVFYFRKRFEESCALNNICCLLKDETIYCELVQWCNDCTASTDFVILAQYLGALNDVLFPPNMCSNEGVDLLMRRSKDFPGILSPKIEVATKVRIDEVWNPPCNVKSALKTSACRCPQRSESKRQKQVCHTAIYHRSKCPKHGRSPSRSRSGSAGSRSCCSLTPKDLDVDSSCTCPNPLSEILKCTIPRNTRFSMPQRQCREYCVYNVQTQPDARKVNTGTDYRNDTAYDDDNRRLMGSTEKVYSSHSDEDRQSKTILESRFIDHDNITNTSCKKRTNQCFKPKISPCVCEICERYYKLFHMKTNGG